MVRVTIAGGSRNLVIPAHKANDHNIKRGDEYNCSIDMMGVITFYPVQTPLLNKKTKKIIYSKHAAKVITIMTKYQSMSLPTLLKEFQGTYSKTKAQNILESAIRELSGVFKKEGSCLVRVKEGE
jgi:hypothetical protein